MINRIAFVLFIAVFAAASAETQVLAISGSTREGSYNKLLVKEAAQIAQQLGAKIKVIDLKEYPLPFFDEDLEAEAGLPFKAQQLHQLFVNSQVILIASPEYNASVSAVLKNAIDWVSRGNNGSDQFDAFTGKKFVLLSASPGRKGGARGLIHLKAIIEDVNGKVFAKQFSLASASHAFDEQGHLKDAQQKASLKKVIQDALKE